MDGHAARVRRGGHRLDLLRRAAGPAVTVVGILEADQSGHRDVDIARPDVLAHLRRAREAALRLQRERLHAAEHRRARTLVVEDVRVRVEDDLLPRMSLREHRREVALGARRDEERGLLGHAPGRLLLEPANGRILLPDVVANLGAGHGLAHGGSRQGECIRAKVDDVVHGCAYLVAVRSRWAARRPHSV
jgi:hypothetical protein